MRGVTAILPALLTSAVPAAGARVAILAIAAVLAAT
jgi:hypothetical protein